MREGEPAVELKYNHVWHHDRHQQLETLSLSYGFARNEHSGMAKESLF